MCSGRIKKRAPGQLEKNLREEVLTYVRDSPESSRRPGPLCKLCPPNAYLQSSAPASHALHSCTVCSKVAGVIGAIVSRSGFLRTLKYQAQCTWPLETIALQEASSSSAEEIFSGQPADWEERSWIFEAYLCLHAAYTCDDGRSRKVNPRYHRRPPFRYLWILVMRMWKLHPQRANSPDDRTTRCQTQGKVCRSTRPPLEWF